MYNGLIIIRKEKGFTSHDVVAKLRGIAGQKKIGHTGTLDPQAEGVLPVCLGNATRVCGVLTDQSKEYVAALRLGITTDTQDMTGTILTQSPVRAQEEEVRAAAGAFVGAYMQLPPMYSALKVNGKRLYELARQGQEAERTPRRVTIDELEILKMQLPMVTFRVVCSKGTYIRTLCADIGEKLSCGGCMESLVRTRVGRFTLSEAHTLSEVEKLRDEGRLSEMILPTDTVFAGLLKLRIKEEYRTFLENGNACRPSFFQNGAEAENGSRFRVYHSDGRFFGIYEYKEGENLFKPYKMFIPQ